MDNASENNNTNIAQSDLPLELLLEKDNDIDSKNENGTPKDKEKAQNIVILNKFNGKAKKMTTKLSIITIIITFIFFLSFFGISIADIVIQIINPNGLNPYLIDDILLYVLFTILLVYNAILPFYMKISKILQTIIIPMYLILVIGCYIVDNIIFFKYFFEKNKSPKYIKDFYLSYIIIKFSDLGLVFIFIIITTIYLHIIPKEKKKEEIESIQLILREFIKNIFN